jgi:two-component system, NarL family, response regulator NreC
MNIIRILIVDDHTLIRECLVSILANYPEIEIVAEADNGADAVKLARELLPDVVVMDISMNELNGIEATRLIAQELPSVKILMLSVYSEPRYVVESLNAGALGFLSKSCLSTDFLKALRTVASNRVYLSNELQPILGSYIQRRSTSPITRTTLTPREREVLVMLTKGKSYGKIAEGLVISPKTVETHRSHIMKKLKINNMAELTKYAIREGLLLLD